jgi:hypothetical protein
MTRDQRANATVIDRRGILGFSAGLAGFGIGLGAVVLDEVALGLVAGICAFISAVTIVRSPATTDTAKKTRRSTDGSNAEVIAVAPQRTDVQDNQTPLLPGDYFEIAVRSRVRAARRFLKPLAVIRLSVTDLNGDGLTDDETVKSIFAETLRECDTACILGTSEVGLVLEDTPENGAVWVVERLRRAMPEELDCRMRAGVACYPAHAMDAGELLQQVDLALSKAAEWSQDRIEVALSE